MKSAILSACLLLATLPLHLQAGESTDPMRAHLESEVGQMVSNMGKALEAADCKRVSEFFADAFTFYVNGRHLESHETVLASCQQIPRPFPDTHVAVSDVRPLSENSAISLRVLNLLEGTIDGVPKREVISQVWSRNDDGQWRIVHMHVSLNDLLDDSQP